MIEAGEIQEVPHRWRDLYSRFEDGSLDAEIDKKIKAHGYGTLSTGQRIGAFGATFA